MEGSDLIRQVETDLQWLYHCPPLFESQANLELPPPKENLTESEIGPVSRFLESKASYRVGYYVESLVQVWLETTAGVEDVQHGIQVQSGKSTLGELDFLFRRDGHLCHLEVALKFYLYHPDWRLAQSHFVGPNARDTLERKRDHLHQHQLPLGPRYNPEIEESLLLVKGILFYPITGESPDSFPEGVNPWHRRGIWFHEGAHEAPAGAIVLRKPGWITPGLAVPQRPREHSAAMLDQNGMRLCQVPASWPKNQNAETAS